MKSKNSWFPRLSELTDIYELPSPHDLIVSPPTKYQWNKLVNNAVNSHWLSKLSKEAKEKSTLKLVNLQDCKIGKVHNIWSSCGSEPFAITSAGIKVKIATGTVLLQE
ncbi:Uncharacterised protein r2_g1589 [Pycnogonum litorale]